MTSPLRLVDRLQGTRAARWLSALPATQRVYRASRAVLVRERLRFALSELAGRRGTYRYTLSQGGQSVVMRHDYPDVAVLDELFWWGFYDVPEPLRAGYAATAARRPLRVVDLGANIGLYGVWCRREWPGCVITAYEPDEDNGAICARAIAADGGRDWTLVRACAGPADGVVSFAGGQGAQSHVTDDGAGRTVPIRDAFDDLQQADVVKIDIEGSEWPILADPRMRELRAPAVLLEYHRMGAPTGAPRADAERLLAQAGYTAFAVREMPQECGILWAWRPEAEAAAPGGTR